MERYAETLQRLEGLFVPYLRGEGFELVELEYKPRRGSALLRLTVDRLDRESFVPPPRNKGEPVSANGVTLDDCVRISKGLSPILDVEDIIPGKYEFQVSSPGVNRPLTTPAHFAKAVGERVRVKTRVPVAAQDLFIAPLREAGEEALVLDLDPEPVTIPYRLVARANLEFDFAPASRGRRQSTR